MTHGEMRQFEVKFKDEILSILKENHILASFMNYELKHSSEHEDQKLSYDMIFHGKVEISIRIRRNEYLRYKDFTIRTRSKNGYECEIDKLINGKGNIYFYGWMCKDQISLVDWIIVDINKIRQHLSSNGYPLKNKDGTEFKAYSIVFLEKHDAIINQKYHLPF